MATKIAIFGVFLAAALKNGYDRTATTENGAATIENGAATSIFVSSSGCSQSLPCVNLQGWPKEFPAPDGYMNQFFDLQAQNIADSYLSRFSKHQIASRIQSGFKQSSFKVLIATMDWLHQFTVEIRGCDHICGITRVPGATPDLRGPKLLRE